MGFDGLLLSAVDRVLVVSALFLSFMALRKVISSRCVFLRASLGQHEGKPSCLCTMTKISRQLTINENDMIGGW